MTDHESTVSRTDATAAAPLGPDALPKGHRLRIARQSVPGETYCVTICCRDRVNLLEDASLRDLARESIRGSVGHGVARLDAFVVNPDHIHLVFELSSGRDLGTVVGSVKRVSARRVNEALGRTGALWQEGFYDHLVRDRDDHDRQLVYLMNNPVRRGLAREMGEYPWCGVGPWYPEDDEG